MADLPSPSDAGGPGVLYFDPNPTTAKLASAGLRLAGYAVFGATTELQAVELCRRHGPGGDGRIVALLLDTATSPSVSTAVLRALIQVPGATDLPGILLVSRANPDPIPGAESLPTLKRPFTTPALLKILRESIDAAPPPSATRTSSCPKEILARVSALLGQHFEGLEPPPGAVEAFTSALITESVLPSPVEGASAEGSAVFGALSSTRLESILMMLSDDGARGVLTLERDACKARLHVDRGHIRLAEIEGADEDLRLGRFVVEAGFMSHDQLEAVAQTHDPDHRVLGQRLVEDGHLRRGELARVLINQVREVVSHLLTWDRGKASDTPTAQLHPAAAATSTGRTHLGIPEALLEGLRRRDEANQMGPHMATVDDVYIRVDEEIGKIGRNAFTREELGVLELLNGRNSVKEVARRTRTGTFAVANIVYRLTRASLTRRRIVPVEV